MKEKVQKIFCIQLLVLIYSIIGILSKVSSNFIGNYGLVSWQVIASVGGMIATLAVYAFFWQKVLKNVDLSIAYANKGVGLLWTLVWSYMIFGESITRYNIIGVILICIGVIMVTCDE